MKLSDIDNILSEKGLKGYMYISIGSLSYADYSISILKKGDSFECYLTLERGHAEKWATFYSEEKVCDFIVKQSMIQKKHDENEKYFKKYGVWPKC